MIKNREIFVRDPAVETLINNGQARITGGSSGEDMKVLCQELSHFVCEGKYADGTVRMLESFLTNLNSAQQPAVWVSGFYGSGKSHLLKMLHHLWVNTELPDGVRARSLVTELPRDIEDALRELDTNGRRSGGLHAASGTLPAGANSPRLAILGIILRSCGLPENYVQARFCIYLRDNGFFDAVVRAVESKGKEFHSEINNLYVSPILREALIAVDPGLGDDKSVRDLLRSQFPQVDDISTAEFLSVAKRALAPNGELPATILCIDEIQQYIASDNARSRDVAELAEALSKEMNSRVLLVGAGQSALGASTPHLVRLQARFTIRVELQDQDVETVTRKVLLRKKPEKITELNAALEKYSGEITRHLAGTKIGPRTEDRKILDIDYPLLPTRRRFWEAALRAVDPSGTSAMLRAQLQIIDDALRKLADKPLGTVIPGDFIFEQLQTGMVEQGVLLRELDETIRTINDGSEHGKLGARLCGLIFLIRRLPREHSTDLGVRANDEMIGDLLVSDLNEGGTHLRKQITQVLASLVEKGVLLKDGEEYDLQTKISLDWEKDFRDFESQYRNQKQSEVYHDRDSLIRAEALSIINGINTLHGQSRVKRKTKLYYGDDEPQPDGKSIPIWIRDGWGASEKNVVEAARQAGTESPIIFAFIPKLNADDLKREIVCHKSATQTIASRGLPSGDDGLQAYHAMEIRAQDAQRRRDHLITEIVNRARVFKGGGEELHDISIKEKIRSAADDALDRLFPRFKEADHKRWPNVINRAKQGDDKPLEVVDWNGETHQHTVCLEVMKAIGAVATGREIHNKLENSPWGWPADAIDGALIALHATGHITAKHSGTTLSRGQLDQNKISKSNFHVEMITIGAAEKVKLRSLFQEASVTARPSDDLETKSSDFIDKLEDFAKRAGGEAPLPERPKTTHLSDLRHLAGNERLAKIIEQADMLKANANDWKIAAELAEKRLPSWRWLERMINHGTDLEDFSNICESANSISDSRLLLDSTDHVKPLIKQSAEILRAATTKAYTDFKNYYDEEIQRLNTLEVWKKLNDTQRKHILSEEKIDSIPEINVGSDEDLLKTLDRMTLSSWSDKINALPVRFANAAAKAAKLLEPKTQQVHLKSESLNTEQDVKAWLTATEQDLLTKIKNGPIVIS